MTALGKPTLKGQAIQLLSRREHSRAELERKLSGQDVEPAQLQRTLDELQARGFIDDQRVVDSVVHRRSPRFGAALVRQELLSKGIESDCVAAAVAELRNTELERAQAVWRARFAEPPRDAREQARQMRFLAGRGFSAEVIARVLRQAGAQDEDA